MDFREWCSEFVNMASKKYASILERKFFALESEFLTILSIVASYVKSKCQILQRAKKLAKCVQYIKFCYIGVLFHIF